MCFSLIIHIYYEKNRNDLNYSNGFKGGTGFPFDPDHHFFLYLLLYAKRYYDIGNIPFFSDWINIIAYYNFIDKFFNENQYSYDWDRRYDRSTNWLIPENEC